MGYLHIKNLYAPDARAILGFKRCKALEKVDGTSAHVSFREGRVHFSAGGASAVTFKALFDETALAAAFAKSGHTKVTVFGEAYGGKIQGLSARYGKDLRFVAFDVHVDGVWLNVDDAAAFVASLGLEFVHYVEIDTGLASIDAERDAPSVQARRNGIAGDQRREGVVLRPVDECVVDGERVICKHRQDKDRERSTPQKVVDPAQLVILTEANAIAKEFVTPNKLAHVLQTLPPDIGMDKTPVVMKTMIDDLLREEAFGFVDSDAARAAIKKRTAALFKAHLNGSLHRGDSV